jgi:RNA polymerase sigma-32 factor
MIQDRDPVLSRYLTMVQNVPVLTREEESALAMAWCTRRDRRAASCLVRSHLRYVVACAFRYRRYGVPLQELIAEGNFGLAHALTKFQPDRGCRFVTYAAYWVRAYVLNYIIRCWSMVGGGAGPLRSKLFFRLRRERARLSNLVGEGELADELLGQSLGVPSAKAAKMMRRLDARDLSLDSPVYPDSPRVWADLLPANQRDQEESLGYSESREYVQSAVRVALAGLDPRERYVVEARLMASDDEELSLAEVGRRLGVSRERARQLESRAKQKLRASIRRLGARSRSDWLSEAAA